MLGSYEMAASLIALKAVNYGFLIIQFILICFVDKTVLKMLMVRAPPTDDNRNITVSSSLDAIDTETLLPNDQVSKYTG